MTEHIYFHECCDCGVEHCEFDTGFDGKPLLIFDDGGWFCRECWRVMDAKRDAEYGRTEAA